ncbi:ERF family protein [Rathayibacter sp. VKM Ac-2754]|uniref:ERF family protein n=1 Tax=Rathayibacter sp. VKM Ac-2754 TaxID=2609251 RepID=UPI00135B4EA8|nr:ERF family protein [Rathayibacter sp. VKM Ac-2754]MWV58223.1 hypothetical protein [Rathayibacter sp. VKM Ac-2754]
MTAEGSIEGSKLAAALVGFRADVPVVKRNATGQAGSRTYKYADLATVEETAQPHLAKHRLAVTQPIDTGEDGFNYLRTVIRHESGEREESRIRIPLEGVTPQQAGSVITYYRRYAFTTNLGIAVEGEDDDGDAGNDAKLPAVRTPAASSNKPATEKQLNLIGTLAMRKGKDEEWYLAALEKVRNSADASAIINKLSELEDAQ